MKIFYKYTNWLYKAKRLLPLKLVPWGKYFIKQKKIMKIIYLLYNGLTRKISDKFEGKRNCRNHCYPKPNDLIMKNNRINQ